MAEVRVERRLAAILAADVAGYSRMMSVDEEATLAALKAHRREVIDPKIAEHRGRIVKTTGDGALVEFASAINATRCAVEIQRAMAERNVAIPEDRRVEFRIGINVGDIIIDEGDIFGDGVNIAARVEALASPGAICVSENAYQQIKGKLALDVSDMGEQRLKNIAQPVRIYIVRLHDTPMRSALALPNKQSIAVLPFANMSSDAEQEYFADGITEDIITDLSKLRDLFVIARNSTFVYKGKSTDVRTICRELGVAYALEGSVRRSGQRVRITAQLVSAQNGDHLWAERFDRDLTEIFAVQDEVREQIVAALSIRLGADLQSQQRGTIHREAYDFFLRGRDAAYRRPDDESGQARKMFESAIARDPSYAAPYAGLGYLEMLNYANQRGEGAERALQRAEEFASKALNCDPRSPDAHLLSGIVQNWRREHDEAVASAQAAIRLDPNFARAYALLGQILHYAGRNEEGLVPLTQAIRLDPHGPDLYYHFVGQCHFMLRRYEQAAAQFEKRIVLNPGTDITRVILASCYGHLGRDDDARSQWKRALEINPRYSLEQKRSILPYRNKEDFELVVQGLKLAGLPN
jgi:TolB-like protein/class 3 adenylate cyclase/Tfp pilus assembly protein PilF